MVRSRGHYPSDVLVGGAVGIAVALVAWKVWPPGDEAEDEPARAPNPAFTAKG
jgi:membrane-associated phospholipid phosphatase